jgi:DNA-binding NarL/FixJ family response regulator
LTDRRPVDVVLVDDHPLFSRGLALLLPGVSDGRVRVVGTTDDASAAAALVRRHHADVAVVDLHMPPPGGTRAIAAIRRTDPLVRVVALSGMAEPEDAIEALRAGAAGYLPKTADPETLVRPCSPSWTAGRSSPRTCCGGCSTTPPRAASRASPSG